MPQISVWMGRAHRLLPPVMADIGERNAQGAPCVLLVPEQFTLQAERELLAGQTEYMEESEGYMTHTGECTSFIGGLRAAATAAASEHLANVLEMIAVLLTLVLCVVLSFARGLADLPLWGVALYLITWCLITILPPALKKG